MTTTATTYFGNRARAAVVPAGGTPALANLFTVGRGFDVEISWDTAELYGIDSILRVDEAKYQLQAITELKGCKFDPAGATGIMQMIFNSLNGATSGTGTITDTNTMYLMDVYVYEVGSVTPGSNLFAAVIYNAYLEGVPIPFTENDFVTLDLKFHGRTAAITSAACPTS